MNHRPHKSRKARRQELKVRKRSAPGTSPGMVSPDPSFHWPEVEVISFGPTSIEEHRDPTIKNLPAVLAKHPVNWINVEGLGDAELIESLGEIFHLHRLALEDVVNLHQRAKVEVYGDKLFIVLRMASCEHRVRTEQVSIFIGPNWVLHLSGTPGDAFDRVRQRIAKAWERSVRRGRITSLTR